MNPTRRFLILTPFLAAPLLAAACGTTVVSGNAGGAGGAGTGGASSTAVTTVATTTSTTSTTTTTTTTSTSSGAGGSADAHPPPPPVMLVAPDGVGTTTFAMSKLYFGDTDRDGTPDKVNGWKHFGYDIDGKVSTAQSTDLCKPIDNASPQNVYPDGTSGIDNAFGKNILPILLGIESNFSQHQNDVIVQGKQTFMIDLVELGSGAVYDPLPSRLYPGADLGASPQFDGSDVWPIDPAGLTNPADPTSAKVVFAQSYVTGNTWVGIGTGSISFNLNAAGFPLPLTLHDPIVSMDLNAAHTGATNGTISGVLLVGEFVAALKQTAGSFDPSLCTGPTIDSIIQQVSQAADILGDGSQDPSKACEAISIGLGFDASTVTLGPVAAPTPPPPNPCP
jgi:hypothetical protein